MKTLPFVSSLGAMVLALASGRAATVLIDFESLADSSNVGSSLSAAYGLTFANTIALKSGLSLNEFDFPPHSGSTVVGDNGGAMTITFQDPAQSISGFFSFGSRLTFTALDSNGAPVGSFSTASTQQLGSSLSIALGFSNVSRLTIAGALPDSFVMDDLSFVTTRSSTVPDNASTAALLACGLFVTAVLGRKRLRDRSA